MASPCHEPYPAWHYRLLPFLAGGVFASSAGLLGLRLLALRGAKASSLRRAPLAARTALHAPGPGGLVAHAGGGPGESHDSRRGPLALDRDQRARTAPGGPLRDPAVGSGTFVRKTRENAPPRDFQPDRGRVDHRRDGRARDCHWRLPRDRPDPHARQARADDRDRSEALALVPIRTAAQPGGIGGRTSPGGRVVSPCSGGRTSCPWIRPTPRSAPPGGRTRGATSRTSKEARGEGSAPWGYC